MTKALRSFAMTRATLLQNLQSDGVIGVGFNAALLGTDFYRNTSPLLRRLRDSGLWAQLLPFEI